jgi:predicted membrane-bound spermidine synthase
MRLMKDLTLSDASSAAKLFALGAVMLLIGALLDLNMWPLQDMATTFWGKSTSTSEAFRALSGYCMIPVIIFWSSRPSRAMQRLAFISWPISAAMLWLAMSNKLSFFDTAAGYQWFSSFLSLLFVSLAIPTTVLLLIRLFRSNHDQSEMLFEIRLRYLCCLVVLFNIVPAAALTFTATVHPLTFDTYLLHWDEAAGLSITPWLINAINAIPGLQQLVEMAYGMTPIAFCAVALKHLRDKPAHVASGLLTWVVLSTSALFAYHFFPVTGPKYVFGIGGFVNALNAPDTIPIDLVLGGPYPRNGMPSMHFGWMLAASILWWRTGSAMWSRVVFIAMTTLCAMATLYLGEHYVADLIVAVPFVLAVIAMCTTAIPFSAKPRLWTTLIGFGVWLSWIILLRSSIHWLSANSWACWLMILATAAAVVFQARWLASFPSHVHQGRPEAQKQNVESSDILPERKIGLMFFASGVAALVYQVLFAKQLALVFGSTATATFTVLATFLGGMAIGSLLGSRLAAMTRKPLASYAFIELLIAVYCMVTPMLFTGIQDVYVVLASGYAPDAPILLVLRILLGAVVLLIPTVLMGATLPLLTQALSGTMQRIGAKVAWLYFVNTAGAATGALMTSYLIIPLLGARSTTLLAAVLNLLVCLSALQLAKQVTTADPIINAEPQQSNAALSGKAATAALISLGIGGILSLGLEVVYVHMLSIVAGNSVYAFGLMLATFLIGLSLGGEAARRLLMKAENDCVRLLCWSLIGLAITVAGGMWWWNEIPVYFASFAQFPMAKSFVAREAIRGIVCALLMIPPTIFVGAAYVLAMDVATAASKNKPIAVLGLGAALNTLGNITGVIMFGFVLLPWLGGLDSTRIIAVAAVVLSATVMLLTKTKFRKNDFIIFASAFIVISVSLKVSLNYEAISSGANVYFYPQDWGKVTDHTESIDGGLTAVAVTPGSSQPIKTLLTNGKFQGNDAWRGEMQAQIGFALAPLLHQDQRDRALVIGYGTGVTSRVLHGAGFKQLDIAELSADMVQMANTHFASVNEQVTTKPGVKLHVTDGRNLLLLSSKETPYDLISIEITSIWFAGAASLYNQEFYKLARSRMKEDGVLQQWMQLHHLAPLDILSIIASLREEFKFVSFYVLGGQGILVATNNPNRADPSDHAMQKIASSIELKGLLEVLGQPLGKLAEQRLLDARGIDRFINGAGIQGSAWVSTDDNLSLEYSTPKANVNNSEKSMADNFKMLSAYR